MIVVVVVAAAAAAVDNADDVVVVDDDDNDQSISQNLYSAPSRFLLRGDPDKGKVREVIHKRRFNGEG